MPTSDPRGRYDQRGDEMVFAAYDGREKRVPGRGRDKAGILGIFDPGEDQPIATAETLDELERESWAFLGREPSAILYLTDAKYRIHDILINTKYHAEMEKARQIYAIVTIILVFCLTCLVAASLGSFGKWPLVVFMGALVLYGLCATIGIKELEAAVLIEIVLIGFFITHAHAQALHEKTPAHRERGSAVGVHSLRRQDLPGAAPEVPRISAVTVPK
jgi:hypothetical protein